MYEELSITKTLLQRLRRLRKLEQMQALDPIEFEKYVGLLFRDDNWEVFTTVSTGDEGVDLFVRKGDHTGIVQCKRYAGTVGQPVVRDLYGSMVHNQVNEGWLVTTGNVSKQAEKWASDKMINLVDGSDLVAWVSKNARVQMDSSKAFAKGPKERAQTGRVDKKPNDNRWMMMAGAAIAMVLCLTISVVAARRMLTPDNFYQEFDDQLAAAGTSTAFARQEERLEVQGGDEVVEPTQTATIIVAQEVTPEDADGNAEGVVEEAPTATLEPTAVPTVTLLPTLDLPTETPEPDATETPTPSVQDLERHGDVQSLPANVGITVDANPGEWPQQTPFDSEFITYQTSTWNGSDDVEARWMSQWDANFLYFWVQVSDDAHVQVNADESIWRGDSLEIEIDTDIAGDEADINSNNDDFQIIVSPGDFGSVPVVVTRYRGQALGSNANAFGHQIAAQSRRTGAGYDIEIAIPWSELDMTPNSGTTIGLALTVNDIDAIGSRDPEMSKSNVPYRAWRRPDTWGRLTLDN